MVKTTQTRQEHYDDCVAKGLPLPELIKPGKGIMSEDVNTTDVRDYDADTGEAGPWRRAES